MGIFKMSLAGTGYVVLNIIRVLNIIALLSVMAASAILIMKVHLLTHFVGFQCIEHGIKFFMGAFLIVTELPFFKSYIEDNWPLFSHRSGFVALGSAMIFLGASILGNLNDANMSQERLGMPFWRMVIGGGFIVFIMGPFNILASYVFRESQKVTARQVRARGAVASHIADVEAATPKTSQRSRTRDTSLPSYHPRTDNAEMSETGSMPSDSSESLYHDTNEVDISKPNPAHHPAMRGRQGF